MLLPTVLLLLTHFSSFKSNEPMQGLKRFAWVVINRSNTRYVHLLLFVSVAAGSLEQEAQGCK